MNIRAPFILACTLLISCIVSGKEYHVAINGSDNNPGTAAKPFRTINKAASLAMPGDIVTVHAGTYREMIVPPRGGTSDSKRIVYRSAPGEKVYIKGSEIIKGWQPAGNGLWKVQLPYAFFKKYNPFTDKVYGDWYGGWIHTGEVYLDGKPLSEVETKEKIMDNIPALKKNDPDPRSSLPETYTWFAASDSGKTTVYARFGAADPNTSLVEVNVRPACFYPEQNFIDYITISGFEMSQAASQWAAPTAEQPGLIGTNWSKGWIIENNIIHDAKCTGITLGKDRATGDNMWSKDRTIDGSAHYNEAVHRVIANGWNREQTGSHIVRNNTIYNCGQAGICGSFGGAFSQIIGNNIYDIYTYRPYGGAEIAGIKLHAAIDVIIKDNYLHNATLGIWLDWMAQGTHVTGNLLHDNTNVDLFMEVDHGPYIIDNNIFLSTHAIQDWSQGGTFAHNLIGGTVSFLPQGRTTPFFTPHTTKWLGIKSITGGNDFYYNNVFTGSLATAKWADAFYLPKGVPQEYGLHVYDKAVLPVTADGNLYLNGKAAVSGKFETHMATEDKTPPELKINPDGQVQLVWEVPSTGGQLVTTQLLGEAQIPKAKFENPDGSALKIDYDYFGKPRDTDRPVAGPFQSGAAMIKVWPK
ncbi:MAG TPA: right-handed parallel beta-helix repeat-containing protein [Chitinophagaceae bacterium]|nr:right-handed parallel beta-helix repeat-containing protein [Chitinophagaceae bacterium]